jgi:membrane protein implicated in regulation of membrane protease activity
MLSFLVSFGTWDWFVAGGVLLVLEVLAPGVFMLWLGLAALLVGAISLVVDWPWQAQFVAFAVLAIAAIPAWRRLSRGMRTDQPFLNRRADAFVGRVFTLESPSSTAPAPSASTTQCGGSAAPIRPPAARSRSHVWTAPRSMWSRRGRSAARHDDERRSDQGPVSRSATAGPETGSGRTHFTATPAATTIIDAHRHYRAIRGYRR